MQRGIFNLVALLVTLFFGVLAQAEPQKFKIDPVHTAVIFKVSHLGFSTTYGQFTGVSGQFLVDDANPANSNVEINIKADSVNTHDAKRDKHLKGPDFFDTKKFKDITFKSKTVKKVSANVYDVSGTLSLHGVSQPLTFRFKQNRVGKDPWGGTRTGGDTTFKIKRSDFQMNFMQGENMISDEVEILVSAEGILQ